MRFQPDVEVSVERMGVSSKTSVFFKCSSFCGMLMLFPNNSEPSRTSISQGGLSEIEAFMKRTSNLDAEQFAALLQPFSVCADWLNQSRVQSTVAPIIERAVTYVRELSDEEFKLKVMLLIFLPLLLCCLRWMHIHFLYNSFYNRGYQTVET